MALPVRKARRKTLRKSSGEAFVILLMLAALLLARKCSAWTTNNVVRTRPRSALLYSTTTPTTAAADSSSSSNQTKRPPTKFVDFPFAYRQELELEIETLTNRGWGIGRVSVAEQNSVEQSAQVASPKTDTTSLKKWVVMVPNVIPGERVRVRIFRNFANYSEGDCVEIIEPSPERCEPVCALASDCGGCQLQHWEISKQRDWKTDSVRESLAQYGLVNVNVSPCVGTPEHVGYRSKLTPHFNAPEKRRRGTTITDDSNNKKMVEKIGFQRQTSRQIIDVETCPIATPQVNAKYQEVRQQLLSEPWVSKKGATLIFRQDNLDENCTVTTQHKDYLTTTVRGLHFTYQAGNFFQNNYHVLPIMVDHVVEAAASEKNRKMTHLVDCYCGSGLFALSTASQFDTVVGIEINDKAVAEATANAVANNITNCQFRAATAEAIFADIGDFPRDTTTVVVDPPRKGCSDEFLDQLYAFAPRKIVYMSCDPTTQARDAQGMVAHGYRIQSVQPFDLFPQTRHIECLMVLERIQKGDDE